MSFEKTTGLQVVGAGFGRTGTSTLKAALDILGHKSYHMRENYKMNDFQKWIDIEKNIQNGEQHKNGPIFAQIFDENSYTATADFPASLYYLDLVQNYSSKNNRKVKVILTVKDAEKWHASCDNTIFETIRVRDRLWFKLLPSHRLKQRFFYVCVWGKLFNGLSPYKFNDKQFVIDKFNDHIDKVKQNIDPEDLLIYSVKEGWEPLCTFLGKDIPNEPFPFLNNKEEFRKVHVTHRHRSADIFNASLIIGFTSLIVSGIYYWKQRIN